MLAMIHPWVTEIHTEKQMLTLDRHSVHTGHCSSNEPA